MDSGQNGQAERRRGLFAYKVVLVVFLGYVVASAIALLAVYPFRDKAGRQLSQGASPQAQGWTAGTVVLVGAVLALVMAVVYLRAWRKRADPTVMTGLSGSTVGTFPGYLMLFCAIVTFWTLNQRGHPWRMLFIAALVIVVVSLALRIATWTMARRSRTGSPTRSEATEYSGQDLKTHHAADDADQKQNFEHRY